MVQRYKKYKFTDGKVITLQVNAFGGVEIKFRKGEVLQFLRLPNSSEIEVDEFLNLIIDVSDCEIIDYDRKG